MERQWPAAEGRSQELNSEVSVNSCFLDKAIVSPLHDFIDSILPVLHEQVKNFRAGRLADHLDFWKSLTSDRNILNTVKGLSLELFKYPYQKFVPHEYKFTDVEKAALSIEIDKMLEKHIIVKADWEDEQYISNIFLRDKKDGSFRIILNLSTLNEMIEYHKFKMDTLVSAINLITPNCYMASIDFKDAYYSVAIRRDQRKWLRFTYEGELYEFTCLPNGLTSGPRLFTKVTKPVFSTLREKGHLNTIYIDDSLLIGDTWEECASNIIDTIEVAMKSGFVVHPMKSIFEPTQEIEFLGFWLNSVLMTVKLTERKASTIKVMCVDLLLIKKPSIRTVAKLIGKLVSSFPGVMYGKLFYRVLDNEKTLALKQHAGDFEAHMKLSNVAKEDLQWWIDNILNAYCPIVHDNPSITVFSDASLTGWGGTVDGIETGGNWSVSEQTFHINVLELFAVYYVLASLCNNLENCHIRIMVDNKTALAYINNMGGRKPLCNSVTRKIWMWCKERNIWLSAAYITSSENVIADRMSRISHQISEWELKQDIFNKLVKFFGEPSIDLFASRLNYKCDRYVAWQPDPFAVAIDAFTINWGNENLSYIFPPFCLIGRVLQKIDFDKADAIVIVPYWTTQPWWSKLLRLLTTCPLSFYRTKQTLNHPHRDVGELPKMLMLACSLSGKGWKQIRYQPRHKRSFCPLGGNRPVTNTKCISGGGITLQLGKELIFIHRM